MLGNKLHQICPCISFFQILPLVRSSGIFSFKITFYQNTQRPSSNFWTDKQITDMGFLFLLKAGNCHSNNKMISNCFIFFPVDKFIFQAGNSIFRINVFSISYFGTSSFSNQLSKCRNFAQFVIINIPLPTKRGIYGGFPDRAAE